MSGTVGERQSQRRGSPFYLPICIITFWLILQSAGCSLPQPVQVQSSPAFTVSPQVPPVLPTVTPTVIPTAVPVATVLPWEQQQSQALPLEENSLIKELPLLNRYDLQVKLDLKNHAFQGSLVLDYSNTETVSLSVLYFRLLPNGGASYGDGSLLASHVTVSDQPVETQLSLSDTVLEVKLLRELKPGERAAVKMDFNGVVPVDFGGESAYGLYNYTEQVLTLSGWYPVLAVYDENGWNLDPVSPVGDSLYSDMALYRVEVIVEKEALLAATSVKLSGYEEGNDRHWLLASGPARDFFIAASPLFQVVSRDEAGTQVNSYYLPGFEEAGKQALEVAAQSLRIFNRDFGLYPYAEFDVVQAPLRNAGGVEFPEIVLIESDRYKDPRSPVFETTVAHETAHQWWYNVVGNNIFTEPWLDEALATYSSSLYFQQVVGPNGYQGIASYWQKDYDRLIKAGEDDLVTRSLGYFVKDANARLYGPVVYTKGALFFYTLRQVIGDQAFFQALQEYYQDFQFRIARGRDLKAEFEKAAGKDLSTFYIGWLYSKH